jgi:hypothetical protein
MRHQSKDHIYKAAVPTSEIHVLRQSEQYHQGWTIAYAPDHGLRKISARMSDIGSSRLGQDQRQTAVYCCLLKVETKACRICSHAIKETSYQSHANYLPKDWSELAVVGPNIDKSCSKESGWQGVGLFDGDYDLPENLYSAENFVLAAACSMIEAKGFSIIPESPRSDWVSNSVINPVRDTRALLSVEAHEREISRRRHLA